MSYRVLDLESLGIKQHQKKKKHKIYKGNQDEVVEGGHGDQEAHHGAANQGDVGGAAVWAICFLVVMRISLQLFWS